MPDGTTLEMRCATTPIFGGESVALRLVDSRRIAGPFALQGSRGEQFLAEVQRGAGGIILVTGPTGSGKSTSLSAALSTIDGVDKVIRSLEDPVEATVPGILATSVGGPSGITFASGLKTFLRMNPDFISIGEIRDQEVAELAVTASLTGHGVFATLHTSGGAETISRLLDLKLSQRTVANVLRAVLSQRLFPKLCQKSTNITLTPSGRPSS